MITSSFVVNTNTTPLVLVVAIDFCEKRKSAATRKLCDWEGWRERE